MIYNVYFKVDKELEQWRKKTHLKVELYGSDLKSILDQLIIQPEIPICSGIPINPITN